MFAFLYLAVIALAFFGCAQPVPPVPEADTPLTAYANDALGFSFEYPARYTILVQGNSIAFQDSGNTALRVTLASRPEATNRGLWGRNDPFASTEFGGPRGQLYRYDHWDGPSYVPTLAFVVPHRQLELGIEFRTNETDLAPVHRRVLQSLRLE